MRKVLVPVACTSCTRIKCVLCIVTKLKKIRMLWSLENPEHFRSSFGPVRGLNLQPMHHFTLGQVTEIFLNSDKNDDRVFVTFNIQNTGWMCHRPEGLVRSHQLWTAWWPVRIHVQQAAQLQYLVEFGICLFGRKKKAVPNPWLKGLQIHKCTLHNHFHPPETCHETLMSPSKTLPSACCNPWYDHTGQIPTIEQQELNQNTFILSLHNPE